MSVLCDLVLDVQAKLAQKWPGSMKERADYNPYSRALLAMLDNQRVSMPELVSNGKDKKVRIEWLDSCDDALTDCTTSCDISGAVSVANCKEYELTCLKQYTFQVDREYRSTYHSREDHIADKMLTGNKLFAEYLSQYIIAGLAANAGTNQFTGGIGTVAGTTTYINPLNWNDNVWAYMAMVNELNDIGAAYYIDGGNLFNLIYNRMAERANADGVGNYNKFREFNLYSDLKNIAAVAPSSTFMVATGAAALVNASLYQPQYTAENPEQLDADTIGYQMRLPFDNRIVLDVRVQRKCDSGNYYDAFEMKVNGLFALNPTPCNPEQTGILRFECGAPSVD
jgi:hypothetical protein